MEELSKNDNMNITKNIEEFSFIVHPDNISMILLSPNDIESNLMHILNKWLFYTEGEYFLSFLKNDNEVNIMLSSLVTFNNVS